MFVPKTYSAKNFSQDALVGVVVALVSIPISMGYALVAGLPVVCGLFGSVLPIALFALVSTSPRFIFGVDAAPAALVGGILAGMGVVAESSEAIRLVPVITLLTAVWLLLFFLLKADRILKFISHAVMGGFITGIGTTIIAMQIPKLFGGESGRGEILELAVHISEEAAEQFHALSFALGISTIALILVFRKFAPKIPVPAILMFVAAGVSKFFHLENFGIKLLPSVSVSIPFSMPDVSVLRSNWQDLLFPTMTIAIVIFTETLLATSNLALKHEDRLNTRREILAYSIGNFAAAFSGCCPVNGSVSRSGIADQFGIRSQVASLVASIVMAGILLFGTGFIAYLPVPVLTGIVISALIGTFEFNLAKKFRHVDKAEFLIFYAAFFSVLLFGTIYGVIVGVLLASFTFIIRQSKPTTDFLGVVQNQEGFYTLTRRGTVAFPIKDVVLYRFTGPLFYANISQFMDELESEIKADTKIVVVDASGVGSIDLTAAERLLLLCRKLEARKIQFFLAGHVSAVNDQLRAFGAESLILEKKVKSRIPLALEAAGLKRPYPVEDTNQFKERRYSSHVAEFEWAFGTDCECMLDEILEKIGEDIAVSGEVNIEAIKKLVAEHSFGYWNEIDEDEFLTMLEVRVALLRNEGKISETHSILEKIAERQAEIQEKLVRLNAEQFRRIVRHRLEVDRYLRSSRPELYEKVELERERYFEEILMTHPALAKQLADIIAQEEARH